MALPASDDFNRADSNPISGGNWTAVHGNIQIISNAVQGTTFNYNLAYWSADAFGNDQYAQFVVLVFNGGGPACRMTSGNNAYVMDTRSSANTKMQKVVGGTFTDLQTGLAAQSANDTVYIEAVGTTIKLKVNGVQLGTDQTDSALSSGSAGLYTFDTPDRYDTFQADNIGAAAVSYAKTIKGRPFPYKPGAPQFGTPFR